MRRNVWRLRRPLTRYNDLRARHSFEAEVRVFAHDHGMTVEPLSDNNELRIQIKKCSVPLDGDVGVFATAIRTGSGMVFLEDTNGERRAVPRGLLEPELRCLAGARTAAVRGLPPALRWSSVAVGVHRVLVSVEAHARELLQHPAAHLQRLVDAGDGCMVAACVTALACDDAAQRRAFAQAFDALDSRLGPTSPLRSIAAGLEGVDDCSLAHLFCHSVISSVDLAACGFDDPDAVRARLVEYDGLWRLLPAPDVGLPTAAWWAQWCDGDMQQCRPMGRSMPAHAVLASLLQLSSAADPTMRLFAERVYDVRAGSLRRALSGLVSALFRVPDDTMVRELFVADAAQVMPGSKHKDVEYFTSVARSVAIEAVQQTGGRYRHLGIARPCRQGAPDFETVKDLFLERGAVAYGRHGALDMGVAAPGWADKAPDLAAIVKGRKCGSVPLTIRRYEFDVARATTDAWVKRWTPAAPTAWRSGGKRPLCATSASMGQGKTVQLLVSLGLLVEAYGGAALYATGNNDQDREVRLMVESHCRMWRVSQSPELAMAMAVFHRACMSQVSMEQAYKFDDTHVSWLVQNTPDTVEEALAKVLGSHDSNDDAKTCVSELLVDKVFMKRSCTLTTALEVARELLGCHDPEVPLFLAVDEVARFATDFPERSLLGCHEQPVPEAALKTIITSCEAPSLRGKVVPMAGALDCFNLEKLATLGSARPVHVMPLSPLIPMEQRLTELLPPIAKAICCQRAEFLNPTRRVRSALSRVGALLMSTGGHARVLSYVLQRLSAVTTQHVAELKKNVKAADRPGESAKERTARNETMRSAQESALEAVERACADAEQALRQPASCEQYGCRRLRHPRLVIVDGNVLEKPDQAECVLTLLTSCFRLPQLRTGDVIADENAVVRKHMKGAWEFAAATEEHNTLKVHPPPVALPAVLSRFLVDATSTESAGPGLLKDRLGVLFDLVLEMNHVAAAFAEAGTPPSEDDAPVEHSKLFELAVGRVIALLLLLPTANDRGHWVANHMQLCRGARTMDPLTGAILPPGNPRYSLQELRALSTKEIHERLNLERRAAEVVNSC